MPEKETAKAKKSDYGISVDEMAEAGVYFGHRISKCHPKMKPYILGVKGSDHINIIDLEQTKAFLIKALDCIKELTQEGKTILLVGTKIPTKKIVRETAEACGLPYVVQRWIGGALTNFKIIRKRIEYFKDIEQKKASGELEKYTKKEQLEFDKELSRLAIKFGGIKDMEKMPDALLVLDMRQDDLAIKEAKMKGLKIIAIADTNVDPTKVDYPIPANDDAITAVKYILEKVKFVILENRGTKGKK
ncbi:30S ribosomal protein S2 [Patescibacteria group bacterium]|nr:30S ribosomal protein S2 [Patescibacteria group bacterium]